MKWYGSKVQCFIFISLGSYSHTCITHPWILSGVLRYAPILIEVSSTSPARKYFNNNNSLIVYKHVIAVKECEISPARENIVARDAVIELCKKARIYNYIYVLLLHVVHLIYLVSICIHVLQFELFCVNLPLSTIHCSWK